MLALLPYRSALLVLVLLGGVEAAELGWPLKIKPALSSTFGESRSSAFHFGVDLKTWGRTGYEVRAVGDGHILRLRTSPWGYGRAVYQKLADGRILVYAHLQDFAPQLAARVIQAQRAARRYSVDIWPEEGTLPVRAGEVIARTGKSGAGPPHLHIELRSEDNVPLNPLTHGFEIEDAVAPTLRRIALIPQGVQSLVEGGRQAVSVGLTWDRERRHFTSSEILNVYGQIGVGLLVYDRTGAAENKLAPYRQSLIVDGRRLFVSTYNRISYADAHQVFLDRTRLEYPGGAGRFYNLFGAPGNRLHRYGGTAAGSGFLHCGVGSGEPFLKKGLHQLVVESEDVAGNKSRALLQVRVNAAPALGPLQLGDEQGIAYLQAVASDADDAYLEAELARSRRGEKWEVVERRKIASGSASRWPLAPGPLLWRLAVRDGAGSANFRTCAAPGYNSGQHSAAVKVGRRAFPDFVELEFGFEQVLRETPRIKVQDGGRPYPLLPRQLDLRHYRVVVPLRANGNSRLQVVLEGRTAAGMPIGETLSLAQQAVAPEREAQVELDGGQMRLVFPAGSAYELLFPQAELFRPVETEHLASGGIGYELGPAATSFELKIGVELRYPPGLEKPEKLGVYRLSEKGKYHFVDNQLNLSQRRVGARVRQFARYALMKDEKPPLVGRLEPASGAVVGRRPRLAAWVEDRGAGIGREEDVVMELDGERLISEYDPDGRTVEYQIEEDLAPGKHRLVVRVRDNSGNEAAARSDFVSK